MSLPPHPSVRHSLSFTNSLGFLPSALLGQQQPRLARAECLLLLVPASQTDWFVIDVPFHAAVRPSGRPSILASPHLPLACMSPGQALGLLISLSNVTDRP